MTKRYYIAYGSNLNILRMQLRCPSARIIGTSEIQDYELLFKGSKAGFYLTIEKKEGSIVPVAVWEVTLSDEAALDRYEGFPDFYYKAEMILPVKSIRSGEVCDINCFVYIMHEDRPLGTPDDHYVEICMEGYEYFGFDPRLLYEAISKSMGNCN